MKSLKAIPVYLFFLLAVVILTACASDRKNPYYQKRTQASQSNANRLGRNRYYFSDTYQKKLYKGYKKR